MSYVDVFVLPVRKKKMAAYLKMAKLGAKIWKEHGALQYCECVGDDLKVKMGPTFPKVIEPKPGETIVFSWIVFKSRAHRDSVNAKVMKDPRMNMDPKNIPFDFERMVYGGFKVIVDA